MPWPRWRLNLLLFLLTVLSTLFAGAYFIQSYDLLSDFPNRLLPGLIVGLPFAVPLLITLGAHELAHFYHTRKHNVDASLPYFIPFPNMFGTMGAVIKMSSRIKDRKALVDIGASGPLVGFVLAVLFCAVGLSMSRTVLMRPLVPDEPALGSSLLYYVMELIFTHVGDKANLAVHPHPIAVAGWVGLFVTSINLMPVGQLDGGHIAYAFLGRWYRGVSLGFTVLLLGMGYFFHGWLLWAVLLMFLGRKHPPVMNPDAPLDWKRRLAGAASLVVFIITFMPVPVVTG